MTKVKFYNHIGTFDVNGGSWFVSNTTTGTTCFICHFVKGSSTDSCYIEYKSFYTNVMGNATILKTFLNDTVVEDCLNGFYSDVYTIKFYDDKHDILPAIELYNQLINGLPVPLVQSENIVDTASLSHCLCASPSPQYTCQG